jgi:hypothetical protein
MMEFTDNMLALRAVIGCELGFGTFKSSTFQSPFEVQRIFRINTDDIMSMCDMFCISVINRNILCGFILCCK